MNITKNLNILAKYGISLTKEQFSENQDKTVIVGMSGGVDSSVSALVTKLMGYKTIGIFMKNWEELDDDGHCSSEKDFKDVVSVCEQLDISYYSLNFVKEYRDQVFSHFLEEYKMGRTPNPDILCNREIKFKVFFDKAMSFGADFLATGHYCQTKEGKLYKGHDSNKDQSYFLYAVNGEVLRKVLFPIGHLEKSAVRELAKEYKLETFNKKDSTGICFIGERKFQSFLSQYLKSQKGAFKRLEDHHVLGEHPGQCYYTVGQRKGLGLGGPGGPWFVAKKDASSNTVFVVEGENHPALYSNTLFALEIDWIMDKKEFPLRCTAKIRYRQKDQACIIYKEKNGVKVIFDQPQRAISVGQSIVIYENDLCLGGAVISDIGLTEYEKQLRPSSHSFASLR